MKKITVLIIFFICSSAFIYAVETKTNTETDTKAKISVIEEQIKNIKDIIVLNNQNTRDILQTFDSNQKNQILVIDNVKYYVNSILIILGIVVTVFVAILGIFIWKENKKSRESMLAAKKDYEKAQELYEKSIEKLNNCSDMLVNKMDEFDRKGEKKLEDFDKLCEEKEKEFDDKLKKKEEIVEEIKTKAIERIMNEQEISMLLSLFNLNVEKENFVRSLQISENILKIDNKNKWGYYGKAVSLSYLSHSEESLNKALICIDEAIELDKTKNQFLYTKASIYVLLGKFNDALNVLECLPDDDIDKIGNKIEIYIILGNIDKAKQNICNYKDLMNKTNDGKLMYGILYSLIKAIDSLDIEESKQIIEKYIYSTSGFIDWSFREIRENLIIKKSYLKDEQKNNLIKIIDLIEQEKKQRKIKRKISR